MSRRRLGSLLFLTALLIVGIIIWSRVRFVFFIPLSIGGFVLLSAGLVIVVYLLLRFLFRR